MERSGSADLLPRPALGSDGSAFKICRHEQGGRGNVRVFVVPGAVNEPLDLVGVLVVVLAYLVSKDVAAVVGPYAAIVVLACTGAALALSGSEESMTNGQAVGFVAIRVLLAVALTVSIAELLQNFAPWMKPRYTLAPIAFGLGWVRDYSHVRSFVGAIIERLATKRADQ